MPLRLLARVLSISATEIPRVGFSFALKFLFFSSLILGWTVVISAAVSRFGITFLPVLLLLQALFIIIGMLMFSVMVDRFDAKKLVVISTTGAIVALIVAALFYTDDLVFVSASVMASGMFLAHAGIFLANHIEETFTPSEAERTIPIIESSETIGGLAAGFFLAFAGTYLLGQAIFWLWISLLTIFLILLLAVKPRLPFYIENNSGLNNHKRLRTDNAIAGGLEFIRKTPFLQVMALVLILNWIISIFIEFQFTKAVDETVNGHESMKIHEQMLAHGLGTLHILIHGSCLFTQIFLANKLLKGLGAFGSFLLHAIMTLLGTLSLLLSGGYFTSVLVKNNYEVSGVVQKNSYEETYYAYKTGSQRVIREFFEGILFPVSTIAGTLLIIAIQELFLEEHYIHVIRLALVFLISGMLYFTFFLKKKYTDLSKQNLNSPDPEDQERAIEILAQKGHGNTAALLGRKFYESANESQKVKIIGKLACINRDDAVDSLLKIFDNENCEMKKSVVKAFKTLSDYAGGRSELKIKIIEALKKYINGTGDLFDKAFGLSVLGVYDPVSTASFMENTDDFLATVAMVCLAKKGINKRQIIKQTEKLLDSDNKEDKWALTLIAGTVNSKKLKAYVNENLSHSDTEFRVAMLLCAIKIGRYDYVPILCNILLYCEDSLYSKALKLMEQLDESLKMHIAKNLLPYEFLKAIPDTREGHQVLIRSKKIYEICEAGDEFEFMHYNLKQLIPKFAI